MLTPSTGLSMPHRQARPTSHGCTISGAAAGLGWYVHAYARACVNARTRVTPSRPNHKPLEQSINPAEQAALAARVVEIDADPWPTITRVGGLDISFFAATDHADDEEKYKSETAAVAALVVLSYPTLEPLYEDLLPVTLTQPYAAGFLAYREAPALVELVGRLRATRPDLLPQVLMVDGNGVLHPRGCGLACHVVGAWGGWGGDAS